MAKRGRDVSRQDEGRRDSRRQDEAATKDSRRVVSTSKIYVEYLLIRCSGSRWREKVQRKEGERREAVGVSGGLGPFPSKSARQVAKTRPAF